MAPSSVAASLAPAAPARAGGARGGPPRLCRPQSQLRRPSPPAALSRRPPLGRRALLGRRAQAVHGSSSSATTRAATCVSGATGSVYVWRTPLVGWEGVRAALGPLFPPPLALHEGVVLHTPDGVCRVYDFLPRHPTDPATMQALLLGSSVEGHLRCRTLSGVPRQQCQLLGHTAVADPHGAAERFQREWDPHLQLLANDCRTHTAQLCSLLLVGGGSGG